MRRAGFTFAILLRVSLTASAQALIVASVTAWAGCEASVSRLPNDAEDASSPDAGNASFLDAGPGVGPADAASGQVIPPTPDAGVVLAERPVPAPLISRGKRLTGTGNFSALTNGSYFDWNVWTGSPTAANPSWVSFDIGTGPARLFLSWASLVNGGYMVTLQGGLGAYTIETSADSTNGTDGTWRTAVTITGNKYQNRGHSFEFAGQRWVRLSVTAAASDAGGKININEVDIHDVTQGISDTWVFVGDSITASALNRSQMQTFPMLIAKAKPGFFPALISAGTGGTNTADGVENIDTWIKDNPDMKFWVLGYGTNDASGDTTGSASGRFEGNLRTIITKLKAAGRTAVLPRPPWNKGSETALAVYSQVVDKLRQEFALPVGPDLYTHFQQHPDELGDTVHPNGDGEASINRLWAEAMVVIYP